MSEASHPSNGPGHRRKKRKLTPDEQLLKARIEAHAQGRDLPGVQTPPGQAPKSSPEAVSLQPLLRGCFRVFRLAIRGVVIVYLLGLLIVTLGINYWGQSNLTTAALMYLPSGIWIAPAFFLLLPALFFDWKSTPALVLAIAIFAQFHLDFQWRTTRTPGRPTPFETLRVLSWNRGQGKQASLQTFKNALNPDIILLQDAAGRGAGYRKDKNYSEFTEFVQAGQFVLMSRWPVISSEIISNPTKAGGLAQGNPAAARFVVLAAGARVTVYGVHLPSPRDALQSYKRGSFLWGILGVPGTPWEAKKLEYQAFWDEQIDLAKNILDRIQAEQGPVLVMGDFNTPAFGPIYHMYAESLQDAHLTAGSGLGYTFPGDTHNPVAFFQPWLRLDQLFASSDWEILNCSPQYAKAQHLPVFGEFKLVKQPTQ